MRDILLLFLVQSFCRRNMAESSETYKKNIFFITGNQGKLQEVKTILQPHINYNLEHIDLDLNEYQGEMDDICIKKCKAAYLIMKQAVIVEDSSLCFHALGGLPGPYIKWFLEKMGLVGLNQLLSGFTDKNATAVCIFGFADEIGNVTLFRGETEGRIVMPQGDQGFGWDSIFQPSTSNQTFAEMSPEDKNRISHRNKALIKLKDYLSTINK